MKSREIHRYKKVSIGICDEDNWYVADVAKDGGFYNTSYYNSLDLSIDKTAKRLNMREAESFTEFVEGYREVSRSLVNAIQGVLEAKKPQSKGKGRVIDFGGLE